MSFELHSIKKSKAFGKKKRRVGRGNASGSGTYSGRGQKGQKSRSGVGGLKRRGLKTVLHNLPKFKGQKPRNPKKEVVNLKDIEKKFEDSAIIDVKALVAKGLIRSGKNGVKLLSQGNVTKKFTVKVDAVSAKAKEAIEKAGGKIIKRG